MVHMMETAPSTAIALSESPHESPLGCESMWEESVSQRNPQSEAEDGAGGGERRVFTLLKSGSDHSLSTRSACRRSQDSCRRSQDNERGPGMTKSGSSNSISSLDSEKLVWKMTTIPTRVRGRAEAWETPREQIEFLHKLGPGTGGEVFLCKWRGLTCAGKVLDDPVGPASDHEEMINEISVMSQIRHPNLVMFLGAVSVSQPLIILTEYMEGGTVQNRYDEYRKAHGKPWRMLDVARAVCFLHNCRFRETASAYDGSASMGGSNPITHRDLRPLNLLLTDDKVLKVTAYGLSKKLDRESGGGGQNVLELNYMAPEVCSSQRYTEKADIYSMAMVFYFILTGERPVNDAESAPPRNALVPAVVSAPAPESVHRPSLAKLKWKESDHLIASMWAEDPAARPDATSVVKGLGLLLLHHNSVAAQDAARPVRCTQMPSCSLM